MSVGATPLSKIIEFQSFATENQTKAEQYWKNLEEELDEEIQKLWKKAVTNAVHSAQFWESHAAKCSYDNESIADQRSSSRRIDRNHGA